MMEMIMKLMSGEKPDEAAMIEMMKSMDGVTNMVIGPILDRQDILIKNQKLILSALAELQAPVTQVEADENHD